MNFAEKIYLVNSLGYNRAQPQLIDAIRANGHDVTVNSNNILTFDYDIKPACQDSLNGYDWLCFFGDEDYTPYFPIISKFLEGGGKVFYQYEVSCCEVSSESVAKLLSRLTNITITPNSRSYVAYSDSKIGYVTKELGCCGVFYGNAYKGLDGLPVDNQLIASRTLNEATPDIDVSSNYGFSFHTEDFSFPSKNGAIVGLGDVNLWYNGDEPLGLNSEKKVNQKLVDFIFPNENSTCYMFPVGGIKRGSLDLILPEFEDVVTLCEGDTLMLDATTRNATYTWSNQSTDSVLEVTNEGGYSVEIKVGECKYNESVEVKEGYFPTVDLGKDSTYCQGKNVWLNAFNQDSDYRWNDGDTIPLKLIQNSGEYIVEVTAECGVAVDTINIDMEDCLIGIKMPNIFTPNGDDVNDFLTPINVEGVVEMKTKIFNRWGELLYETNNEDIEWKAQDISDGVYYWEIDYLDVVEKSNQAKGTVILVR